MNLFEAAAALTTLAALFGYLNARLLRLPSTIGLLLVALVASLAALAADAVFPAWGLRRALEGFLLGIDFNRVLMHGMLSFLLFAGALHVDLEELWQRRAAIGTLAFAGVLLSTALVGLLAKAILGLAGVAAPLSLCLVFGALISPTDPVAVLGLLKELKAGPDIEAKIAGESLFNDGVGVVVFLAAVSLAGLSSGREELSAAGVAALFVQEVLGGALLGFGAGYLAYLGLKDLHDHALELIWTLALVMGVYALSFRLHVSGPIAVVIAGLFIGNHGRRFAMSERTSERIGEFWAMLDEFLNAVLFLLIGLEVFVVRPGPRELLAGLAAIPVVLFARLASVWVPISLLGLRRRFSPGLVPILTWGGLRGGISVALALSLPDFPGKRLLLSTTYAVVLFSILVQGLTIGPLVRRYRET